MLCIMHYVILQDIILYIYSTELKSSFVEEFRKHFFILVFQTEIITNIILLMYHMDISEESMLGGNLLDKAVFTKTCLPQNKPAAFL